LAIDIIVVVLALAGLVYGWVKGFLGTFTRLAAIPVGIVAVVRVSPLLTAYLEPRLPHILAVVCGWLGVLLVTGLALWGLLQILNAMLRRAGLNTANRMLGAWFGLVGAIIIMALLHLLIGFIVPSAWKNLTNQHPALRSLRAIAQEIQGHVPENIVGS